MRLPLRSAKTTSYLPLNANTRIKRGIGAHLVLGGPDKGRLFQGKHHLQNLFWPQFSINRERQKPTGQQFGNWKITWFIFQIRICLLEMHRNRIMNSCCNPVCL